MTDKFFLYLQYEKRYSDHTLIAYRKDLDQLQGYLKKEFDQEDFSLITHHQLRAWLMHLSEQKLESKTINRKIAAVKSLFKFLHKNSLIAINPAVKIRALKNAKKLPTYLTEKSILQLLDEISFEESFEGIRDKVTLEIFYGTGIRLSELISIKTSDINLHKQQLKVLGKGNKERIVPLSQSLCKLIEKYQQEKVIVKHNESESFIVTDTGSTCYPVFIYRMVKKYLTLVTTNDKRSPHTIRHTFATHLLNKGADLNDIKDLLGHSSLAATQIYTHNSIEKLKAVFEKAHPKA